MLTCFCLFNLTDDVWTSSRISAANLKKTNLKKKHFLVELLNDVKSKVTVANMMNKFKILGCSDRLRVNFLHIHPNIFS